MHNRKCTLKPLGDMTLGGGNRILVGMIGTNNSSNKPREKMANSNRTGGDASRDLALNSQGVGRRLHWQQPVMMMAKANFFPTRASWQCVASYKPV
uniref:Uncharacterized protein n=1 Tax=Yersinia enterocolitica W22703 TaxID=913028 RepID=F4MXE9_YEREN|nr:unknown protein [Yersinia enterocolitica W22703]